MAIRFFRKSRRAKAAGALIWLLVSMNICTGYAQQEDSYYAEQKMPSSISFSWWGDENTHEYTIDALETYEIHNQDVHIQTEFSGIGGYKKGLMMANAADALPDVVQLDYSWLKECLDGNDSFYDIHEVESLIIFQNFSNAELEIGEIDGKLYALPATLDMPVILWNEDVLKEYGLSVPETWESLFNAAQVLAENGKHTLYATEEMQWLLALNYTEQILGMPVTDEDGGLNYGTDEMEELLEVGAILLHDVVSDEEELSWKILNDGDYAGAVVWLGAVDFFNSLEENGISEAVVPGSCFKPSRGGIGSWYVKPSIMYAIGGNTADSRNAAELVNYLLSGRDMLEKQRLDKGLPLSRVSRKTMLRIGAVTELHFDTAEKESGISKLEPLPEDLLQEEAVREFLDGAAGLQSGESAQQAAQRLYVSLDKILRKE